jgi:hypothetical protein
MSELPEMFQGRQFELDVELHVRYGDSHYRIQSHVSPVYTEEFDEVLVATADRMKAAQRTLWLSDDGHDEAVTA